MTILQRVASGLLVFAATGTATAQVSPAQEIGLSVDLTDAPRKMIHATETMPVKRSGEMKKLLRRRGAGAAKQSRPAVY